MTKREAAGTEEIRHRIVTIVKDHGAELIAHYYADPVFAGSLFDNFGENPSHRFVSDDLLAASLLDVRFGPQALRALLEDRVADSLLAEVPSDRPLWAADYDTVLGTHSNAGRLWTVLTTIPGVGGTRASKLLARKRPALLPILDSVIRTQLGLGDLDAWGALRDALDDSETRAVIDGLASKLDGLAPTTLRLLDVVTWMRFSESDNARWVRKSLGLTITPR